MFRSFAPSDVLFMLKGLELTVVLSVGSFIGGGIIAVIIALMRTSANPVLRWLAIIYIRVNQGVPVLIQLFVIFFGADIFGMEASALVASIIALSINAGAFLGDIWRGSLESVPRGQSEAARALSLGYVSTMVYVLFPQAIRIAIPPTIGFVVHQIKTTSLTAIIGTVELTRASQLLTATVLQPFLIYGIAALFYFLLCWPLSIASQRLEARLGRSERK